jgi:sugar phosphate isomerase/epimerase
MKFGICSEIFKEWNNVERTIDYVKEAGYDGLEIAPFTLAQYITDIPEQVRKKIAKRAEKAGLEIVGLHWVLVGPEGMHITHPDSAVRERTTAYLGELARLCGELGGKVLIFGSPNQRNVMDGVSYDQAFNFAAEAFERVMPLCEEQGVTYCMEPLSAKETNFCASAAETAKLVQRVNHPKFRMMLDTKAMAAEEKSRPELIREHAPYLAHYHANDENLNGPGWGEVDFAPIFKALQDIRYTGYVSVEVFKFEPGPEAIATKSLEYMKQFA